jgi:hypothetical protein
MRISFCCLLAALLGSAWAQSPSYTVSGQIRYRYELDNRSFVPERKPNQFHLLRSRLGIEVKPEPGISVFLQLQDSRHFGSENAAQGRGTSDCSADAIDFHQAVFILDQLFKKPLQLKIGRQELRYGNERLIGVSNWPNTGRTFDAAVLNWHGKKLTTDVFCSRLTGSQTSADSDNLLGVYSVWTPWNRVLLDGCVIHDFNTTPVKTGTDLGKNKLNRYTIGLNGHGKYARLNWAIEGYQQFGKMVIVEGLPLADIRARLWSAALGYTVQQAHATCITLSACRITGDNNANDGSARQFNTLFGSNHRFYGLMDYYPDRLLTAYGLQDYAVTAETNCCARLNVACEAHLFKTDVAHAAVAAKKIGKEVDLTATWKYAKSTSLQAGLSAFVPDALVRSVYGSRTSLWFYLMSTINF